MVNRISTSFFSLLPKVISVKDVSGLRPGSVDLFASNEQLGCPEIDEKKSQNLKSPSLEGGNNKAQDDVKHLKTKTNSVSLTNCLQISI